MNSISISPRFTLASRAGLLRTLTSVAAIAAVLTLFGLLFEPARVWPNLLLANYYGMGVGLAAVVFLALMSVSNAGWAVSFRRVPEAMTSVLPLSALVLILLFFGIHSLYEWSHTEVVANDRLLQAKSGWLNEPFFIVRSLLYMMIWSVFAYVLVKRSLRQDETGDPDLTRRNKKTAAAFLVVFSLTFTLASMDWIMSLEPHWYSTIFGIYNFSGLLLNGLATMTVLVIVLRRMGPLQRIVNESHLHDLGKLVFAFSTFWMYIWFSQYILIWYANIPEEVVYFLRREKGSWGILTVVNVLFNWAIPFIALLPIWTKRNESVLLRVCVIVMIGHWIDLFWMIMPPFMPNDPAVGIWEFIPMIGMASALIVLTFRTLARYNLVPLRDPFLSESLHLHT
jgi:hypothetical protein